MQGAPGPSATQLETIAAIEDKPPRQRARAVPPRGRRLIALFTCCACLLASVPTHAGPADDRFEALGHRFLDAYPSFSPVNATALGDHRFDHLLDEITPEARAEQLEFYRNVKRELDSIPRGQLSRPHQVDAALLAHDLESRLWHAEVFQQWAWNPVVYTGLAGSSVYSLMAREFAPIEERLRRVTDRLDQLPRLLAQVRSTLQPARVPKIHAETATKQNRGVLSILEHMVEPRMDVLSTAERQGLEKAIAKTKAAVEEHQRWLEDELLPSARGDFRIGAERFDPRLRFALHTPLPRAEVRRRAEQEFDRVRARMYHVSKGVYLKEYPHTRFPKKPSKRYRQAIVRAALEVAYRRLPAADEILEIAKQQLEAATEFVREHKLVDLPDDPVDIILMPEFQRGVSVAYCDSPGPLDVGQKTFYAVSPIPEDWTSEQVRSFLREYNWYSLQDLTMHEAMPGHYLQLAHANRYPSKLRAVFGSGTFIEGWAIYAEKIMIDAGYMNHDPLAKLINLKWYLRAIANAILDQAIHCDGMTREEAMTLMIEGAFQEEREAAGKWVRAQLTSAQLSTYFVGFQEHLDLRREAQTVRGTDFDPHEYNNTILSFGSPPVQYVRALMFGLPIETE